MGASRIRYRPLEGEPAYLRQRPLLLAAPLGVGRLVARAGLALVRLTLSTVIAVVVALVLLNVGIGVAGGSGLGLRDTGDYLAGVLRFAADHADGGPQTPLISETSSIATTRPTAPEPGSTAGLVASLAQLSPSELRGLYLESIPALEEYDAMLADVQAALAENRDLDGFFADVAPWLERAEAEANAR